MSQFASLLLAASLGAMIAIRFTAIPVINRARDAMLAGDLAAKRTFDTWHRGTVVINLIEMIVMVVALKMLWR